MPENQVKPIDIRDADDDDDDLDDLDDVLDKFDVSSADIFPASPLTSPPPPPPTATTTTSFHRPRTNTRVDQVPKSRAGATGSTLNSTEEQTEDEASAEFSKELAKEMENLMRHLSGVSAPEDTEDEATNKAMNAAFEAMLIEGMNGMGPEDLEKELKPQPKEGTDDFQKKVKETMNRLKQSESNAQGASGQSAPNDSIEAMMNSLKDLGLDGEGNDEELAGLFENMMGSLMSKDVLYEPMKEIADKLPGYLQDPPKPISPEDRTRYQSQLICVRKIIAAYDEPGYTEKDNASSTHIVNLMNEMQSFGAPPDDILGPLPPGMGFSPDGTPNLPDGCSLM